MSAAYHAARLDRLRAFLRTSPQGLDAEDAQALAGGIASYFARRCSLDEALGVHLDVGENHPGLTMAIAARNAAVFAAGVQLGAITWANSNTLARKLAAYERGAWQRDRLEEALPACLVGRIERHFWTALRAWPRVIGAAAIHQILVGSVKSNAPIQVDASASQRCASVIEPATRASKKCR